MHDNELSNIKMNKKIIKYVSRVFCGQITVFFGLTTVVALFPDESYHYCEAGQEDLSPIYCAIITFVAMIVFCFVWYKTKNL
jgi:hypothetical protein